MWVFILGWFLLDTCPPVAKIGNDQRIQYAMQQVK